MLCCQHPYLHLQKTGPRTLESPAWYREPEVSRSFISPAAPRQQGAWIAYQWQVWKDKRQALLPPCKALWDCDWLPELPVGSGWAEEFAWNHFWLCLFPFSTLTLLLPCWFLLGRKHFHDKALGSKSLAQSLLLGKCEVLKWQDDVLNAQLLGLQLLKQELRFRVYQEQLSCLLCPPRVLDIAYSW